jgi:hypothetical protein
VRPETDAELARRAVLDSAGEDDWGLWEIFATVNGALPGRDDAAVRALAAGAVRELAAQGLVEVLSGRLLDDGPTTPADLAVLDTPAAWEPAGEQPSYLGLRITPAGEEAYYAMLHEESGSTRG